jgi:hypothetical protein
MIDPALDFNIKCTAEGCVYESTCQRKMGIDYDDKYQVYFNYKFCCNSNTGFQDFIKNYT